MTTKKLNLALIRDREIVKYVRANCLSNRQKMFRVAKYALFLYNFFSFWLHMKEHKKCYILAPVSSLDSEIWLNELQVPCVQGTR
jgi:hypothetical protein